MCRGTTADSRCQERESCSTVRASGKDDAAPAVAQIDIEITLLIGEMEQEPIQIGQYILSRKIGVGGMAEVWEAQHVHLGNRVAIKFLFPEFARNQELQQRFLNEGKRQAELLHPNIVPATDFFQVDGRSYLVMRYIEGGSLESRLQKENPPLSLSEVHSFSWDILSGLSYAHSVGVVHRDVKPSNMLIDKSGSVLLMDFGIALALSSENRMTQTGTAMGTPEYMSPEQITRPMEVDARSDIYSFGCVLYAMLTGDPPFHGEGVTPFYIHDCHVRRTPPPLTFRGLDAPPAVADVVLRCLEKEPEQRFQSCAEVMQALSAALEGGDDRGEKPKPPRPEPPPPEPPKPEPPRPQPFNRGYTFAGAAVALAVLAVALYLWQRPKPLPTPKDNRQELTAADCAKLSYDDPRLTSSADTEACRERGALATKLKGVKDWQQVLYNDPLLQDCMGYQPCLSRKQHAEQLLATTDWSHASKQLLKDCMGYAPCVKAKPPTVSGGSGDDLPSCCRDARDPAACEARKRQEGMQDGCVSIYNH